MAADRCQSKLEVNVYPVLAASCGNAPVVDKAGFPLGGGKGSGANASTSPPELDAHAAGRAAGKLGVV